ncbi:hypothetical protein AB0M34_00585 [Nocardia sp. NPDC050193]
MDRKSKPLNIVPFNNGIVAAVASGVVRAVRFDGSRFEMSSNYFLGFMMMMMGMMMMF